MIHKRTLIAYVLFFILLAAVGWGRSWSLALTVLNLCLISALMSLAVNIQWGYAGLFNVGIMGFAALGGLAVVLVSHSPVAAAWEAGGNGLLQALAIIIISGVIATVLRRQRRNKWLPTVIVIIGILVAGHFYQAATSAIESVNSAKTGFLGGLGLPVLLSWIGGGLLAAAAAWLVGKIALGLRADYLAIATLGISEIIIAVLKHEDWLSRGVKNVTGLARPVPREIILQQSDTFVRAVEWFDRSALSGLDEAAREATLHTLVINASSIVVKLCYAGLFLAVLLTVLLLCELALNSPWGRMMRAIRDDETAAAALGKDVKKCHLQIFILGSAIAGIAGAMLTTLDGQFTPGAYHPLRFTFLIWVMAIVGGAGNNLGAVLGGAFIWLMWVEAEPLGIKLVDVATIWLDNDNALRLHLLANAQHMRLLFMGLVLLLVMRFAPGGILPERVRRDD